MRTATPIRGIRAIVLTALLSNAARARELGRTDDWVDIYFYDDDHHEGQCTVVSETHGAMESEHVVRGREAESRQRMTAS